MQWWQRCSSVHQLVAAETVTFLNPTHLFEIRKTGMKSDRPLELLLLCDFNAGTASTIIDHIYGLKDYSRHTIRILSSRGEAPVDLDLHRFDGVIIHYSLVACLDAYVGPRIRKQIKEFSGIKIIFVQDDYRFIDKTVDAISDLGVHILFGLAPEDIIDKVYPPE